MITDYIGWPTYVPKVVLSDSKVAAGTDARNEDSLNSGGKQSSLKGAFCPNIYTIIMDFEAEEPVVVRDAQGHVTDTLDKTEYQLFMEWYQYRHKYGTVPFYFPKILYSHATGISIVDEYGRLNKNEFYKITSVVNASKSGSCMRVEMTWQTVYGGAIQIQSSTPAINDITEVTSTYIDILFSELSETEPVENDFVLYIDDALTLKTAFCFEEYTARIYFAELEPRQKPYTITFAINDYAGLTVAKDTKIATITVGGQE